MRRWLVLLLIVAPAALCAQALEQKPLAFDVASIKPSDGGPNDGVRFQPGPGGRLSITNIPLRFLIFTAYRIQESQLIGGPDWIATSRFNITAKAEGNPTTAQLFPMLQSLLAERFKLALHHESREMSVYALVLARSDGKRGPALKDSDNDCEASAIGCEYGERLGSIHARGMGMTRLAIAISPYAGRIVVDRTNIAAPQDFDLMWTSEQAGSPPTGDRRSDSNAPSLFTAIEEQLGLKLQPTVAPVDVLVIDRVEKPTPD